MAEADLHENQLTRVEVRDVPILLVRRNGQIFALAETCSHLGGPLAEGQLVDNTVRCPWHGSRFSLENGAVVDGPATHPQPCMDARIRDGQVEVRLRHEKLSAWDEIEGV
jgi:nitrite reductase/ring-hydroxylating ferredoxin subunit